MFLSLTISENWMMNLGFEEPLWDVELFGRLTLCLASSDYISLASCLQVCVGHPLLLCSWLFRRVCILHNYMFYDNMGGTFDAEFFTTVCDHPSILHIIPPRQLELQDHHNLRASYCWGLLTFHRLPQCFHSPSWEVVWFFIMTEN